MSRVFAVMLAVLIFLSGGTPSAVRSAPAGAQEHAYVLNTNTCKFHDPGCASVPEIRAENRQDVTATREEVIAMGYEPCGRCNP